jgi:hypothetical protein
MAFSWGTSGATGSTGTRALTSSGGTNVGATGGSDLSTSDFQSHAESGGANKSFTGPPDWLDQFLQGVQGQYGAGSLAGYQGAVDRMSEAPGYIDDARTGLLEQFRDSIGIPIQNQVNSAVGRAAGRGTLGSSMTGDTLSRIATDFGRQGADVQQSTNVWAANANLEALVNSANINRDFVQTLANYYNMARFTESSGDNASSAVGALPTSFATNPGGGTTAATTTAAATPSTGNVAGSSNSGLGYPNANRPTIRA